MALVVIGVPELRTYTITNCDTHIDDVIQIKHPGVNDDDWFDAADTQLGEYAANFDAPKPLCT